jgi:hypothetical protein
MPCRGGFNPKASNTFYQPLLRSTILLYSQTISSNYLELSTVWYLCIDFDVDKISCEI